MASLDFGLEKNIFREFYNEKLETIESAKDAFISIIKSILAEDFDISALTGRVKDREESIKKFALKYQSKLEENKEKVKTATPSESEVLNVFSFLAIADDLFDGYEFHSYKVDGFVAEILSYGDITPKEFKSMIDENFEYIEKYKKSMGETTTRKHVFNPYTEIRHVLYQSNTSRYQRALYDSQRNTFEKWTEAND
ncbi:hypothetical protein [Pseudoalteromonas denitrificans]|uniref:Uncharacterized protein n=1 Tax=Pseudoalteromonas denitrificans DSM 6059 TaxID=1123010 RepID=A0A1I1UNN9_9GAMM|nr:hypothetical protein [Pseudoalteromonas denitrificans]SFD72472.1 hypothetical protein SAMN02745724_05294 [Pseudoalteromonas denitrificans DSM 6059]